MLKAGIYKAIAYDYLELPDNPNIYWKDGYEYEAIVDERGVMRLASETGESFYTPEAIESMQQIFNFEEYEEC